MVSLNPVSLALKSILCINEWILVLVNGILGKPTRTVGSEYRYQWAGYIYNNCVPKNLSGKKMGSKKDHSTVEQCFDK